jgi:parallel beta-helix repeat protein
MQSYAGSDPGRRENNEDIVWAEDRTGLYIVVDGMGGHRGGERAAAIACDVLRRCLATADGVDARKLKESIAQANNEIYATAQTELVNTGMACVLTVALVRGDRLLIGHVGDTRLYRIHEGTIKKLTRDHSPVGDLEADGLITEEEAMRHPRRHYVYRDVGVVRRGADDPEFIDVYEETFSADAALVLCTDGLVDAVTSAEIWQIVSRHAGKPERAVKELIDLANERGGKDNISVIVVEGDGFADAVGEETTRGSIDARKLKRSRIGTRAKWGTLIVALVIFIMVIMALAQMRARGFFPFRPRQPQEFVVKAEGYGPIADAISRARPGDTIKITSGIYREAVRLRSGVNLVGEGQAQLMPAQFPALVAEKVNDVTIRGLEINVPEGQKITSAAVLLSDANVLISNCQVMGDTRIGVEIRGADKSIITGSAISGHEIGILIYGAAAPRLQSNRIVKNTIGILSAEHSRPAISENEIVENHKREVIVEETSVPTRFDKNVIGRTGVEMRNADLEKKLDVKGNNIYIQSPNRRGKEPGS